MGRRPIGEVAMTGAQRQRRLWERRRAEISADQLIAGVTAWLDCTDRLPIEAVPDVLDTLAAEIKQRRVALRKRRPA